VVQGRLPSVTGELTHHIDRRDRLSSVVPQPTPSSRESPAVLPGAGGVRQPQPCRNRAGDRPQHQIAFQLAHIGCPILGDVRYGAPAPLPTRQIALLSREISLEHPTRREMLSFSCPLPMGWSWPAADIANNAPLWNWDDYALRYRGMLMRLRRLRPGKTGFGVRRHPMRNHMGLDVAVGFRPRFSLAIGVESCPHLL